MPPKTNKAPAAETAAQESAPVSAVDEAGQEATNEVTQDLSAESPVIDSEATHRIAGQSQTGFWRAGRHWPPEGIDVNKADFTDEQWAALEGELKLSIKPL